MFTAFKTRYASSIPLKQNKQENISLKVEIEVMVPVVPFACSVVPASTVNVYAPQDTPANFAQNVSHPLIPNKKL